MLDYFSSKKAKKHPEKATKTEEPVLNDDDEAFLQRITSQVEGTPPPLPERPQDLHEAGDSQGNDMQLVISEAARDIPIPDVPDTPEGIMPGVSSEQSVQDKGKGKEKAKDNKKDRWSFLRRSSKDNKRKAAGDDLHSATEDLKTQDKSVATDGTVPPKEAKKDEEEMAAVLEKLNLAAVNNRVFSISKESQDLIRKYDNLSSVARFSMYTDIECYRFTLVFKDLVNGVPTAYGDLESLLTNSEDQLQKMYKNLPSFMQQLIEKLPSKFTSSLGPEILAAAAEKQGLKSDLFTKGASVASHAGMKLKVPSLKELVTKQGALIGLLRSIMSFLRTRFPAVIGVNVLWSLAISSKPPSP